MPAAASSRQPGASNRFSGKEAQWLLAQERQWLAGQMASRPARPWLWLAPPAAAMADWPRPPPRGLLLHEQDGRYSGSIRCGLPLPLPSDCLGDVVLQHPGWGGAGPLVEECARVLIDGGRLWLFLVNPWSPFRLRRPRDLPVASAGAWQQRLRAHGLQIDAARFLGPSWRMASQSNAQASDWPLGACRVIVAEKRGAAPVAPAPVAWGRGAAPAA